MTNIVTVVGARPQFIKAAVISRSIKSTFSSIFDEFLIHTGQHYDNSMSDVFFDEMKIPLPDENLNVGSGTHGKMTGDMLREIESVLLEKKPDLVLVYGDTNSTLAGVLAASKLHIPVAHIEAGLRSYNKKMPEEQNRIVADHLSSFLFCPTEVAKENLQKEGIRDGVSVVGDVMLDASLYYRKIVRQRRPEDNLRRKLSLPEEFFLLTFHRAENTDSIERLSAICEALNSFSGIPSVFPIHPRTKKVLENSGIKLGKHIHQIDPIGFFDMIELETNCSFIVTDSGGIQKEAYFFEKPCITLRDETEWVETVTSGWNVLVGADPHRIIHAIEHISKPQTHYNLYGDGDTGTKILKILEKVYA